MSGVIAGGSEIVVSTMEGEHRSCTEVIFVAGISDQSNSDGKTIAGIECVGGGEFVVERVGSEVVEDEGETTLDWGSLREGGEGTRCWETWVTRLRGGLADRVRGDGALDTDGLVVVDSISVQHGVSTCEVLEVESVCDGLKLSVRASEDYDLDTLQGIHSDFTEHSGDGDVVMVISDGTIVAGDEGRVEAGWSMYVVEKQRTSIDLVELECRGWRKLIHRRWTLNLARSEGYGELYRRRARTGIYQGRYHNEESIGGSSHRHPCLRVTEEKLYKEHTETVHEWVGSARSDTSVSITWCGILLEIVVLAHVEGWDILENGLCVMCGSVGCVGGWDVEDTCRVEWEGRVRKDTRHNILEWGGRVGISASHTQAGGGGKTRRDIVEWVCVRVVWREYGICHTVSELGTYIFDGLGDQVWTHRMMSTQNSVETTVGGVRACEIGDDNNGVLQQWRMWGGDNTSRGVGEFNLSVEGVHTEQ
ncbi:hypothetical protein Tco_0157349 [Tanacetum coccineum]